MTEYLTTTRSACRVCRRLIPARIQVGEDGVWMEKICPEHGLQSARVYGDAAAYPHLNRYHRRGAMPATFATSHHGCPDSCGLCPDHEQHVCLPILEITDHCNLECPICLTHSGARYHLDPHQVSDILDRLIAAEGQIDVLNLSGGEPTLNPDFRAIIETCVSRREILRVSVSTNGILLARDKDLLRFLTERHVLISLQFDGFEDEVYRRLRGRPLWSEKQKVIEECGQADAAMSLTVTVVRGVNDQQLPEIAAWLFRHPHIVSVMIQPAAYTGRAASLGRPADALTIPDLIAGLDGAAAGTVSADDYCPLPCSHPACFSLAFYLRTDEHCFRSIRQMVRADQYLDMIQNRAILGTDEAGFEQVIDAIYTVWSGPAALSPDSQKVLAAVKRLVHAATRDRGYQPARALAAAERAVKSIFLHQFMDPDTFDLSRVRKCCQVYPQPDGRLVPACVRNCLRPCPS